MELYRIAVQKINTDGADNGNVIQLWYRKKIFGLYMNYDGFLGAHETTNMRYSFSEITFYGDNEPLKIDNGMSDYIAEKEKVDSIMSYDDAKKRVGTGLAENLTYTVKEAGLRYACPFTQEDEYHTYRPMWCFVLYEPENKNETTKPDNDYMRITAFVDAINGDLYYCNPFEYTLNKNEMK